jgi:predicted transcriptional regulator
VDSGKTQQETADMLGVSQPTVVNDLSRNTDMPKKVDKPRVRITYQIQSGTKPETAAKKIKEKFGVEFAEQLVIAVKTLAS